MLDAAASVVTVNSTAAQQTLWRALPVKVFGQAIYGKPGFVSDHPLAAFLAAPTRPDLAACRCYRKFLPRTNQARGGFYSARERRELLRRIVELMVSEPSPHEGALAPGASQPQQLRRVR
jgi:capsular polysaccharide export protein